MSKPILMPTKKPAKAPAPVRTKRFSLVPDGAQLRMFEALKALKRSASSKSTGCEIAEVALCSALAETDPVLLASSARGASIVRKNAVAASKAKRPFEAATVAAVDALLSTRAAAAAVCAGKLNTDSKAQDDYRNAFDFAARHKLPILYLVGNAYDSKRPETDLRVLSAELGIPVFSVDANDAIAAYRVTTEALHHARHSRGPSIIEALRVSGTPRDPLGLLQGYMERHGTWPL